MNGRIFFEYAYLVIAVYCGYEAYNLWNVPQSKVYIYVIFGILSLGMFIFRRYIRIKNER